MPPRIAILRNACGVGGEDAPPRRPTLPPLLHSGQPSGHRGTHAATPQRPLTTWQGPQCKHGGARIPQPRRYPHLPGRTLCYADQLPGHSERPPPERERRRDAVQHGMRPPWAAPAGDLDVAEGGAVHEAGRSVGVRAAAEAEAREVREAAYGRELTVVEAAAAAAAGEVEVLQLRGAGEQQPAEEARVEGPLQGGAEDTELRRRGDVCMGVTPA